MIRWFRKDRNSPSPIPRGQDVEWRAECYEDIARGDYYYIVKVYDNKGKCVYDDTVIMAKSEVKTRVDAIVLKERNRAGQGPKPKPVMNKTYPTYVED